MSHAEPARPFPRGALAGAAGLIGMTMIISATASVTGIGRTTLPDAAAVESRDLHFIDRADGAVGIYDPQGEEIAVLPPGSNGFARGVLRGLARERKRSDIGMQPPFRLTRWADGRLSLEDDTTRQRVALEAFGPTNSAVFARLLERPVSHQRSEVK